MKNRKGKKQFLILGAGISGLTAARALKESGFNSLILEACPSVGGLTRTIRVADFCFDYTGHFLHLANYNSPSEIPFAGLNDEDWQLVYRKSLCHVNGRLMTAPIQYHIGELGSTLYSACKESYESRPRIENMGGASFRDFMISGFGKFLADLFLIPQNEKTLAISLDRLSINAVTRFFPPPDERKIKEGMKKDSEPPREYNARFWYPRLGGIDLLVKGLGRGLDNIKLLQEVRRIDLEKRTVSTAKGDTWQWDYLLTSIPLPWLCRFTKDAKLIKIASALTYSSTVAFNLGVKGPLPDELKGVHWIYFPDREIPFYRLGFYSNISAGICRSNLAALYAEVGLPGQEIDGVDIIGGLQPKVIKALSDLGWIKAESIVCSAANLLKCAYVHHTPERERVIDQLFRYLRDHDIYPIGRYGLWDYISMEDSIDSAINTVARIIHSE